MKMATFGDIPRDVLRVEILPKLDVTTLGRVEQVSTGLHGMAEKQLLKDIREGILRKEGWGPERIYELAKNNTLLIKRAVIDYLYHRLYRKTPVFDYVMNHGGKDDMGVHRGLANNPNVTTAEKAQYPNIRWRRYYIGSQGPTSSVTVRINENAQDLHVDAADRNFGIYDFVNLSDTEKYTIMYNESLYASFSSNINLRARDVLENRYEDWDWNAISKNPNITKDFIFKHPDLPWKLNVLKNPNISPQEIHDDWLSFARIVMRDYDEDTGESRENKDNTMRYNIVQNPNLTLEFLEAHPEYNVHLNAIARNKFTKDSDYRYLIYSYIYRLLPKEMVVLINKDRVTGKKEFLYGMTVAINMLNLDYKVRFVTTTFKGGDYHMLTNGTANQPYKWVTENNIYNFSSMDFISGIKKVYESNNLNFPGVLYTDRRDNSVTMAQ